MGWLRPVGANAPVRNSARQITCPDGSKPRILFAEDSYAARTLTAALLTKMGCEVDAVEHGEHALVYASEHAYDLILLDIEMPIMDGVCAARKIRELGGRPSHVPIMALSAFLADTAKAASIRGNFDLALAKPAGRDVLHAAIQTMLDGAAVDRGLQAK